MFALHGITAGDKCVGGQHTHVFVLRRETRALGLTVDLWDYVIQRSAQFKKKKKKMLKRVCSKTADLMEKNGLRPKIAMVVHEIADTVKSAVKNKTSQTHHSHVCKMLGTFCVRHQEV